MLYLADVTILSLLIVTIAADKQGNFFKIEKGSFFLEEGPIWDGKTPSLFSCSLRCARRDDCKSANFVGNQEACMLLKTQAINPEKLLKQEDSFYLEKVSYL